MKIKRLYSKYQEIISYVIVGALTTVVSLSIYYLLVIFLLNPKNAIELQIANILSWIGSVLFAYFANKKYVFNTKNKEKKEFVKFILGRVFTLIVDILFMYITVSIFTLNDKIMKILSNILVLILNYIISKFFVFLKRE